VADLPPAWVPLSERAGVPIARWFVWPVQHGSGQVTGALGICLTGPDDVLSPDEERLVGQLAQAVTVALTNLRAYTQEHQTALTLQRALLPDRLPVVAGLEFAARYSPSSDVVSVGGDFYDAFVLPSGRVAVVIGDIQGHSLQAATVMAEMRFSLRAYVLEGHPPATVVGLLNRLLLDHHPDHTTTLVLLLIDPVAHTVEIANAGHLPPLLLSGTDARYVEGDGVLLGVPSAVPSTVTVPFPAGGTFVLTTDGLIERRGENLDLALARLAAAVVGAGSVGPEELADQLLIAFDAAVAEDDVALVIVRRTAPPP
jgi:serine phosphatase RsbU (regulator of sigma subunit)